LKIDPSHLPSPVVVQAKDQEHYDGTVYKTCSKQLPPLVTTKFACDDEGLFSNSNQIKNKKIKE